MHHSRIMWHIHMIPQTMKKNDLLLQDTLKIPSLPVLAWAKPVNGDRIQDSGHLWGVVIFYSGTAYFVMIHQNVLLLVHFRLCTLYLNV